jgi:hypothetical protein
VQENILPVRGTESKNMSYSRLQKSSEELSTTDVQTEATEQPTSNIPIPQQEEYFPAPQRNDNHPAVIVSKQVSINLLLQLIA